MAMTLQMHRKFSRELDDWLHYSGPAGSFYGLGKLLQAQRLSGSDPAAVADSLDHACAAFRHSRSPAMRARCRRLIERRLAALDLATLPWQEIGLDDGGATLAKGIVLKPYLGPREKGVVYVRFPHEWIRMARRCTDLLGFAARYTLIVATTSSPPHNLATVIFPVLYPEPFFCTISNEKDLEYLPDISPNYLPVPILPSAFVNPEPFRPRPFAERDVDVLMVALWGKVKRHHLLFKALRRMPRDLKVLLIGQDEPPRTHEDVLAEARWYGVADRFELQRNQPFATVVEAYGRSKVSILLSQREGAAKCVGESMFGDCPVGLIEGAEVGSRVFINEQTGRFLSTRNLAADLLRFVEDAPTFRAREWAMANITCHVSSRRLNEIVKERALAQGQDWTVDLAAVEHSPDPTLVHPADRDRIRPEYAVLEQQFGIDFIPARRG